MTRQQFAGNNASSASSVAATFASAIQAGEAVMVLIHQKHSSTPGIPVLSDGTAAVYEPIHSSLPDTPGVTASVGSFEAFLCRSHPGGGATVVTAAGATIDYRAIGAWRVSFTAGCSVMGGGISARDPGTASANSIQTGFRPIYCIPSTALAFAAAIGDLGTSTITSGTNWSSTGANGGATGRANFQTRVPAAAAISESFWQANQADTFSVGNIILFESVTQPPFMYSTGVIATDTTNAVQPAMPRGYQQGDYLLLAIEQAGTTATLSSAQGFSAVANSPVTVTGNATRLTLFDRIAASNNLTAPTINAAADHTAAQISCFRYNAQTSMVDVTNTASASVANTSMAFGTVTTTIANELVICTGAYAADANTAGTTGNTSTVLTGSFTSVDGGTTLGNGGGIVQTPGVKTATGATGSIAVGINSSIWVGHTLALKAGIPPTTLVVAAGRADETDAALALLKKIIRATGRADETGTAISLNVLVPHLVGRADETDTAIALHVGHPIAVGRADETDVAGVLQHHLKIRALGRSDETDTAFSLQPPVHLLPTGGTNETDTAFSLNATRLIATGRADEVDEAFSLSVRKIFGIGRANETDTAFTLQPAVHVMPTGRADEVDEAFELEVLLGKFIPVGEADELDEAFALSVTKSIAVGMAEEIDTAFMTSFAIDMVRPFKQTGIRGALSLYGDGVENLYLI